LIRLSLGVSPDNRKEYMLEFEKWNKIAPIYYHAFKFWPISVFRQLENKNIKALLSKIPPAQTRALDIGCGTGNVLGIMKGYLPIFGLDFSSVMLKIAKQKSYAGLLLAHASQLPFKNNSFDLVLAIGLGEYIKDLNPFFIEVTRLIKPEGYLLFTNSPDTIFTQMRKFIWEDLWGRKEEEIISLATNLGLKFYHSVTSKTQIAVLFRKEPECLIS
jgi:ubiquinone/menaquinone biosynthesis C-methylase UbiE